jgi:hypothetical protein
MRERKRYHEWSSEMKEKKAKAVRAQNKDRDLSTE